MHEEVSVPADIQYFDSECLTLNEPVLDPVDNEPPRMAQQCNNCCNCSGIWCA
jgi:hypothetical protein